MHQVMKCRPTAGRRLTPEKISLFHLTFTTQHNTATTTATTTRAGISYGDWEPKDELA